MMKDHLALAVCIVQDAMDLQNWQQSKKNQKLGENEGSHEQLDEAWKEKKGPPPGTVIQ